MITIQNGKLNIPDNDRFVGFAGDNAVMQKQFILLNRVQEGCTYTLCLRFDDDTVRTAPLSAAAEGGDTVLTWTVKDEELYTSGITAVQLKIADSLGNIAHTTKDYFLVGSSLDGGGGDEAEYVTPSQLKNSINRALSKISATAPYIDEDGYWCIYDPETDAYRRTDYHVDGIAPDSAMSDVSDNAVSNKVIKQYVDTKAQATLSSAEDYADGCAAGKVPQSRTIAGLPLSADIVPVQLAQAILPSMYKTNVIPGSSVGIKGNMGIGPSGEVYFCTATDNWAHLVEYEALYEKMDLIAEVTADEARYIDDGNLFFCNNTLYAKRDGADVAIAKANDVYTKAEIDTMIGNLESLLASI